MMKVLFRIGNSICVLLAVMFFMSSSYVLANTDVGGSISEDTTWTLEGSPYQLTVPLMIAESALLTIEPGVVVNGNDFIVDVFGSLVIVGTKDSHIILNDFVISTPVVGSTISNPILQIEFVEMYRGAILPDRGTFSLLDSYLEDISGIYIESVDFHIERNIFIRRWSFSVDFLIYGTRTIHSYIRNNLFYHTPLDEIDGYASIEIGADSSKIIIEYNSFLNADRLAILSMNNSTLNATNNYWGTTETNIIDSRILDGNDPIGIGIGNVNYIPFLTEPHQDTPSQSFNQYPFAYVGDYSVVFDEIYLDGSQSSDDGTIILYQWSMYNTLTDHLIQTTGINPLVTGLTNGFYDVCLTVTDDEDGRTQHCGVIAAAGAPPETPITQDSLIEAIQTPGFFSTFFQ